MRRSFLLFLTSTLMVAASARAQNKPWPKICLTKGCTAQEIALALAGAGGSVQAMREHRADLIQTEAKITRLHAAIESAFGPAVAAGYVPYSQIPRTIRLDANNVVDMDKLFASDRSVPVNFREDVLFVAKILGRIQRGPYRITGPRWTVVPTKQINSSAFPNPPFIFVYTSMLDFTHRDPDMMAFVIAHEIGHTIDAQACSGSGAAQNAGLLIPGVQLSLVANQLFKFCENHADNIALQLVAGAGYDPKAAIKLFEALEQYQNEHGADSISAFLGNHPLNSSRIKNVEELLPIIQK